MEVFRIQIKPQSEIDRHDAFKKSQHNCPLCEASLEFQLDPGPEDYQVIEKAHCRGCDVNIRTELHSEN